MNILHSSYNYILLLVGTGSIPGVALAASSPIFDGPGVGQGISRGSEISGSNAELRPTVLSLLETVLGYMALAAVAVIIIAGIMLVVRGEDETVRERARRAIFYAILGLIVILLARAIVGLYIDVTTA